MIRTEKESKNKMYSKSNAVYIVQVQISRDLPH